MSLKFNICVILSLCVAPHFNFMTASNQVTKIQEDKLRHSSMFPYDEKKINMNDQDLKLYNPGEKFTLSQCSSLVYKEHTPLNNFHPINQDVLIETLYNILKFITCSEGDVLYRHEDVEVLSSNKFENKSYHVIRDTSLILEHIKAVLKELLKFEALFSYPDTTAQHYFVFNQRKICERWKTHFDNLLVDSEEYARKSLEINFKEFYLCFDLKLDSAKNELFSTFDKVEHKTVNRKLCEGKGKYFSDMQIVIDFLKYLSLESKKLVSNMHKLNNSKNKFFMLSGDMVKNLSYVMLANFLNYNMQYHRYKYDSIMDAIEKLIKTNDQLLKKNTSKLSIPLEFYQEFENATRSIFDYCSYAIYNNSKNGSFTTSHILSENDIKTYNESIESNKEKDYDTTDLSGIVLDVVNTLLLENETVTYDDIDALFDFIKYGNEMAYQDINKTENYDDESYINNNETDSRLLPIKNLEKSDLSTLKQIKEYINKTNTLPDVSDENIMPVDIQYVNDEGDLNNESALSYTDEVENFVNASKLLESRDKQESVNFANNVNTGNDKYVNKTDDKTRKSNSTRKGMPLNNRKGSDYVLSGPLSDNSTQGTSDNSQFNPPNSQGSHRTPPNLVDISTNPSKQEMNNITRDEIMNMVDVSYKYDIIEKNNTNRTWPIKQAAEISGDVLLGGLMMVHSRSESVTCGPVMAQGGIQALETMLYTLDVINARKDKKITLGAHILDDCDTDTYGLEMALDFIKGSISNIDDTDYHCNKTQVRKVISGVVGAASSVTSIQVANLLRLFKIPQVSFFSTSPELSNKQRFEYFTRTIPSDHYQVKAMVEIVKRLKWSYVSIIYEESNYGIKAFEELEVLLAKSDICIAVKEKLVKDSGVAEEKAYDDIVGKLMTKPRARGVIVFGSDQEVAGMMRAVRRMNVTGGFSWVGSDGWSARGLVSDGAEPEVEGTLSLQPQANPVRGFDEYFLNLTVENNKRNPWFVEFWEDHFRCKYPNSSRTPYNAHYTTECTTREKLTRETLAFEKQLQFVSDAVMAFSKALDYMHQELCGDKVGMCDAMRPTKGAELLKYLRKVSFQGLSEDYFKFDKDGDGPARYNIIHFKQTSPGQYQWVQVGEYLEGELHLNMSAIQFKLKHPLPPESVCSLACDTGQAKKYVEGEICCWHCFNCSQYQIRMPTDETQCLTCPAGTKPDTLRQSCLEIPAMFIEITSTWAIGAMTLSSTGILMTLLIAGVFIHHNNTPVVKAAGRELSYVLLFGILLCYLVTFVLVLRPSDLVCAIQRFGAGFCFTVVYAALLTKTNRISRIFNAGKRTAKRPSFITPKSQLIICGGLISVQVLINGVWMLVSPPRAIHHYPSREDNILVCSSFINASYMIAFGYPILLIVVCTVYAILTRNIPEAFNESKHIGFTMYTTCVIWLAFVPLYFGTGNHMPLRITTMSVTISLSASVTVACLFSPKLYIILLRPDRNVRTSMMMTYRYSGGTAKTTTSVSMMAAAMAVTGTNSQITQQLTNAVTQKCLELEMNSLKNHNCSKSPLLITRSTQTLVQDAQEVLYNPDKSASEQNHGSTMNTPTSPTSSSHIVYHLPSNTNSPAPTSPTSSSHIVSRLSSNTNSPAPTSPPALYSMVPSSHSPYTLSPNEQCQPCIDTPYFHKPASINGGIQLSNESPTSPSPYTFSLNYPSQFCLDIPSFHNSTANGGTRLSNENHASL